MYKCDKMSVSAQNSLERSWVTWAVACVAWCCESLYARSLSTHRDLSRLSHLTHQGRLSMRSDCQHYGKIYLDCHCCMNRGAGGGCDMKTTHSLPQSTSSTCCSTIVSQSQVVAVVVLAIIGINHTWQHRRHCRYQPIGPTALRG